MRDASHPPPRKPQTTPQWPHERVLQVGQWGAGSSLALANLTLLARVSLDLPGDLAASAYFVALIGVGGGLAFMALAWVMQRRLPGRIRATERELLAAAAVVVAGALASIAVIRGFFALFGLLGTGVTVGVGLALLVVAATGACLTLAALCVSLVGLRR